MDKPLRLSTASANWNIENGAVWKVVGADGTVLKTFPYRGIDEKLMMSIIRFGREFELEAFNIGASFGKDASVRQLSPIIAKLNDDIKELSAMNERLSTQLEKFIIGDE